MNHLRTLMTHGKVFTRCKGIRLLLKTWIPGLVMGVQLVGCNYEKGHAKPVYINGLRQMDTTEIAQYNNALQKFFDSLLLRQGFSGGILVAKNGKILFEHYQGFEDETRTLPINEETPFHVASTSKTFTSTAIMQLVRAGKVRLEDSVQTYFELFPYKGITVRHLLNHSSGLPNYANYLPKYKWDKKKLATNYDVLQQLYANRPALEFTTGSQFKYCNTNFVLLALIVEKASGRFFPDFVRDSIFKPAGMEHSYVVTQINAGDFTPSWNRAGKAYAFEYLDAIYGDKNVFTTCRDLMRYDSAIRHEVLLQPEWYAQAWTPQFPDKKYRDTIEYYGLGWRLKVFNDSLMIPYHNGWWHGNNAVFQRLVADTAVIIVTGNRFMDKIYSSARAANIFRPYYSKPEPEAEAEEGQGEAQHKPATSKKVMAQKKPVTSSSKKPVPAKAPAKKRR